MPPPAYIGEGNNMQSGGDVCLSVCDSVRDNPRIFRTAKARDFGVLTKYAIKSNCVRGGVT